MSASPTYIANPGIDESLISGEFDVAASATPEQLPSTPRILEVILQAKSTNTGKVFVGGSSVANDGSSGVYITAGQSISISVTNLNKIWLAVETNGEGVSYTATKE